MHEFRAIPYSDKRKFYNELTSEMEGLYESCWLTNLANASASLMAHLPNINWAGFYLWHEGELKLGPFQGFPACLKIPLGKGVCGTAAQERKTIRVENVELFPGHIACDSRSRSEIVIPLLKDGRLLGVLDIDSPELNRFSHEDQVGLEKMANELIVKTYWPEHF